MRNPKSSTFKILKLRSGEELIAKIKGTERDKLVLERPMIFRTIVMQDSRGYPKELTTLKSWIPLTNDLYTKIPYDFVAAFVIPTEEAVIMYNNQKMKEDLNPPHIGQIKDNFPPSDDKMDLQDPQALLDVLRKMRQELDSPDGSLDDIELDDEEIDQNMVAMTIFFPPSVLTHLLDGGMINDEHIKKMIEELKSSLNNDEDDKKINPNTPGNRPEDWGNTVLDYLPDDSQYLQKKKKRTKKPPKDNNSNS